MDNKNELINGIIDSSPVPAGPRTIMIVEDEVLLAFEIKETLEKNGYEVIATAVSGLEAIQKADQYRPDLILMDINLQGKMDGTEAAAVIRLRYNIPVIFLTAYSQRDLIEKAKLARPFSYLIKPVSEDYLIAAVSVAFYTHSMEKKLAESEERFRLFFDSYPDPIAILNREKKILLANSKFRRVLAALRGSNPQQQNNPAELPDKNINITDTLPWQAWELSFLDKILDAAYFDLPSKTIQINLCGSWYEVSA
ncbi:MAG: response regulator, partial [Thermoplasmata archaeon]